MLPESTYKKANKILNYVKRNLWLPFTFLAFAMIIIGVLRGEVGTMFAKAIRICLECIGIG